MNPATVMFLKYTLELTRDLLTLDPICQLKSPLSPDSSSSLSPHIQSHRMRTDKKREREGDGPDFHRDSVGLAVCLEASKVRFVSTVYDFSHNKHG